MVIGGYALPFRGRIRVTVDLDLAVVIKTEEEFNHLLTLLDSKDFKPMIKSPRNPLILVLDQIEKIEIELWTRLDGLVFDDEIIRRRKKVQFTTDLKPWIISAEDFIVNKLARPDRSVIDEQDVKSVLVRQAEKLDNIYLKNRAVKADVLTLLNSIKNSSEL